MKIIFEIKKYREEVVKIALGDFGISLLNFSKNLNPNHREISCVPITNSFSDKLLQILNLVNYAYENNLMEAVAGINKFYKKNIPSEIENLDKKFIRLIENSQTREELRNNKKICSISLLKFYERANVIWDNTPNDFSMYTRYSLDFEKVLLDAESKANRYKQLGCTDLYDNIISSIEDVRFLMNDIYLGFHRISLRNAALILSKINGFELKKEELNNKFKYSLMLGKNIYNPKLYPIQHLKSIFTYRVEETIKYLEKIPMFDYYMVLVPSNSNSNIEKDIKEIKNNNMIPILIGERDGKCYFISYWI